VAFMLCLPNPPRSFKYYNLCSEEEELALDMKRSLTSNPSARENQISRIVLNDWKFLEYYVEQTLDYCRRSNMLTSFEIDDI